MNNSLFVPTTALKTYLDLLILSVDRLYPRVNTKKYLRKANDIQITIDKIQIRIPTPLWAHGLRNKKAEPKAP